MSNNNDSDWFDDFIIMSMMEEEEAKDEAETEGQESPSKQRYVSRSSPPSESTSGGIGCFNMFLLIGIVYVILRLLAS